MEINFDKLEKFLTILKKEDFENGKLLKAHTINDIEIFGTFERLQGCQIINYGGYFLVDVLGNDLTIVKLTKKFYKIPNGRSVQCKIIKTIIEDCRKTYGTPLNGYWVIPKKFTEN